MSEEINYSRINTAIPQIVNDPLRMGYSSPYRQEVVNTNAGAGANQLSGTVVPVGQIWVLEFVQAMNMTTNPAAIIVNVTWAGTVWMILNQVAAPGANVPVKWEGSLMLIPGERVTAYFTGCAAGDDIALSCFGRKIDIVSGG